MARYLQASALVLLLALGSCVAAQTSSVAPDPPSPCVPRQEASDPAGDVTGPVPGAPSPTDLSPMDLLGVAMWREEAGLGLSGTLAADPRADSDAQFYYWLSFKAETPAGGGNPATWTFQRTSTYDAISTMYWEARDDYPVTWNGTTFSFLLPWDDLEAQYGKEWPMDIGSPSLSSSGPIIVGDPTGMTGYPEYVQVLAGGRDHVEYARELVPLPDCSPLASEPSTSADQATLPAPSSDTPSVDSADQGELGRGPSSGAKDAPALGIASVAFAALALALVRRR